MNTLQANRVRATKTEWGHRCIIVIPMASAAKANAESLKFYGGDSQGDTFGAVRLSAKGIEPATHTACSTLLKAAHRTRIGAGRKRIDLKTTLGTSKLNAVLSPARVYYEADGWDWQKVLSDSGLKVIIEQV